jgi:hypothetical protein
MKVGGDKEGTWCRRRVETFEMGRWGNRQQAVQMQKRATVRKHIAYSSQVNALYTQ